ncbi:S-methyl-5-thioribose-1-phosphate isomerase|uniref:Methylthioribose-1-phosphate isomerase n=1 Tax=Dendrosporobacter quercicolus TaxID=146817 RepID=A0A1G9M011_9FIRM|nr:S-methyl-5-thioribose-1-phosphate isomerase [Dendrosporobacter quercicolus]NSL46872.1 S-methyl-5-thioribose-1-phosphate isomerase [Dendrosporobacter quercicolus DSM 1736]SDL67610.1 methylthioribose-1-phosphate isomerase [Dendrosporobacter quercicolus]
MHSMTWDKNCLTLLNQTKLPGRVEYIRCSDYQTVAEAIRRLEVRGAPAIGAAAAYGLVIGARQLAEGSGDFWSGLMKIVQELKATRPTAVNLFWALDRMAGVAGRYRQSDVQTLLAALEQEAIAIAQEDRTVNSRIAANGAALFDQPLAVLTHCNAGALATVGFGTALGVIRQAWADGNITRVFADETRPLLQGARLTAWELMQEQIPVTLITDSMAGWVMKQRKIQAVIVGADRVTLNGDVANKIGTYSVAVLAKEHGIPFYVAAPASTFDFTMHSGDAIPIEERQADEITTIGGVRIAPAEVEVFNPAFDVTPHALVSALITEYGVLRAPYAPAITKIQQQLRGEQ